MTLVVDASVALKWVLREAGSEQAERLLTSGERLLLPDFWLAEAASVVWRHARKRLLAPDEARRALTLLMEVVPTEPTAGLGLHGAALELAMAMDHTPYDCLYAVFAIAMAADGLVTADAAFASALRRHPDPRIAALPIELARF